jgi:hypothetical protein
MTYREEGKLGNPKDEQITDYSEEAIPERDPSYRPPASSTLCDLQTVEYLPVAQRRALARRLEELGMSRAKAAFVSSL